MINKNDYESRFTSYLKHINGDGQTIQNLFDVFNDMQSEIKGLKAYIETLITRFNQTSEKMIERKVEAKVEKIEKQMARDIWKNLKNSDSYKRSVNSKASMLAKKWRKL